jgi:hypothetical protein
MFRELVFHGSEKRIEGFASSTVSNSSSGAFENEDEFPEGRLVMRMHISGKGTKHLYKGKSNMSLPLEDI